MELKPFNLNRINVIVAAAEEDNKDNELIDDIVSIQDVEEEEKKEEEDEAQEELLVDDEEVKEGEQAADEEEPLIKKCDLVKDCGHACNGVKGEAECIPCLDAGCIDAESRLPNDEELCMICYTSELKEEACVELGCGHVFHANCVHNLLKHRWNTLKISFAFMSCPQCKQEITEARCPEIMEELNSLKQLRLELEKMAMDVAEVQGLDRDERVTTPGDFYYGKVKEFAMHSCSFYECYDCKKPYFGGLVDCQ